MRYVGYVRISSAEQRGNYSHPPWIERIVQLATATEQSQEDERKRLVLRSRLDRLQRLFVAGDLSEPTYEQEKAKVERQLAQLPIRTKPSKKIRAWLKDMGALWKRLTDKERQAILNSLFKGIYITAQSWTCGILTLAPATAKLEGEGTTCLPRL
jgi:hypothetical protein